MNIVYLRWKLRRMAAPQPFPRHTTCFHYTHHCSVHNLCLPGPCPITRLWVTEPTPGHRRRPMAGGKKYISNKFQNIKKIKKINYYLRFLADLFLFITMRCVLFFCKCSISHRTENENLALLTNALLLCLICYSGTDKFRC